MFDHLSVIKHQWRYWPGILVGHWSKLRWYRVVRKIEDEHLIVWVTDWVNKHQRRYWLSQLVTDRVVMIGSNDRSKAYLNVRSLTGWSSTSDVWHWPVFEICFKRIEGPTTCGGRLALLRIVTGHRVQANTLFDTDVYQVCPPTEGDRLLTGE
jgi:hypothetical protein